MWSQGPHQAGTGSSGGGLGMSVPTVRQQRLGGGPGLRCLFSPQWSGGTPASQSVTCSALLCTHKMASNVHSHTCSTHSLALFLFATKTNKNAHKYKHPLLHKCTLTPKHTFTHTVTHFTLSPPQPHNKPLQPCHPASVSDADELSYYPSHSRFAFYERENK